MLYYFIFNFVFFLFLSPHLILFVRGRGGGHPTLINGSISHSGPSKCSKGTICTLVLVWFCVYPMMHCFDHLKYREKNKYYLLVFIIAAVEPIPIVANECNGMHPKHSSQVIPASIMKKWHVGMYVCVCITCVYAYRCMTCI